MSEKRRQDDTNHIEPSVLLDLTWADQLDEHTFLSATLIGSARFNNGHTRASSKSAELRLFRKTGTGSVLAINLDYSELQELDELPPQLTLGEDNGLRGYSARQLSGRKRARLNLENRISFGREWLTFKFGGALFADAGWIGDDSLGTIRPSIGLGLRLASPQITGGRVLRLDVAYPLNTPAGESAAATLSLAIDQVFDFFGNNSSL